MPLEEQDTTLWDADLIQLGERLLRDAHEIGRPGRFQFEAAIQSVHCDRATTGVTDWAALRKLYAALAALDGIDDPSIERCQPAWATRAHLLAELGRTEAAERAFARAISLTTHAGTRRYLERASDEA